MYILIIKYYTLGSNYEVNLNIFIGQTNTLKEDMPILNDALFPSQKKGTILLHTRHIIRIDIFAITQSILLTGPFNLKAEFFIDLNRWGVIDKYCEFNAIYPQPVITHINHFAHQGVGDAAILPTGVDTDTKIGNMTAARALLYINGEMTYYGSINTGDELLDAGAFGVHFQGPQEICS